MVFTLDCSLPFSI